MIISYIRLGKVRRQRVLQQIQERINEIETEYTPRQIKQYWGRNSLSYDMGISGHLCEKSWDYYDIDYKAGQIVEFKNHVFNDHDNNKLEIYRIMQDLNIPFDKAMLRDYQRALNRKLKYGNKSIYKVDSNLEARLYKSWRLYWSNNKKEILVGFGIVAFLSGLFVLLSNEREV